MPYVDGNGNARKYYPDFAVEGNFVEFKGWVTHEMAHKMKTAKLPEGAKLVIICAGDKRYRNVGLSLLEIEANPELLKRSLEG